MALYEYAILILFALAVSDLVVGVSNDAVNFLGSSIGSRVAGRRTILLIASLGILAGVTFSSGMMEVARKGIFNPQHFTMPELMVVFLAVMLTDIILLDLFSTYGLPTSTTVSIVFELLGAAVAVALLKLHQAGAGYASVVQFINTSQALTIVLGILLSILIAFAAGAAVQFLGRLLFTFEYERRVRRYGALWGGVALAIISYFIVIKGAKGASFVSDEMLAWIRAHTLPLLAGITLGSAAVLQVLMVFTRTHVLKVVVLAGTFALAMAFAANDLVNFIGVPLAGLSAYSVASGSTDPSGLTMDALREPVRSGTALLLAAGGVMVVTLWLSRKARTVTQTTVGLSRQDEGMERFESTPLSRFIVRSVSRIFSLVWRLVPAGVRASVLRRTDARHYRPDVDVDGHVPSFDLLRASVNLMVAAALISWATSLKLPLSTTYVTFMVAMGTSLADQAWGRESAVFRVTGVLTVIGGWFFTAMAALAVSGLFAVVIAAGGPVAVLVLLGVAGALIVRTHVHHRSRERDEAETEVFNLRRISDPVPAINTTFEHAGIFLEEVDDVLETAFRGLFRQNRAQLRTAKKRQRRLQAWSNIIVANIFKVLRLLQWEDMAVSQRYAQTIGTLQEITESTRDIVMRASVHVSNHHAGLLPDQVAELRELRAELSEILRRASKALREKRRDRPEDLRQRIRHLEERVQLYDRNQIRRIQQNVSKTRLTILVYAFLWDSAKIAGQTGRLLTVFQDPLRAAQRLHQVGAGRTDAAPQRDDPRAEAIEI